MHRHEPEAVHNLIVLQGAVSVRGEDSTWFYMAGEMAELPERHEIVAREERTVILCLFRNGKPEPYGKMPESERSVRYESKLHE